MADLSIALENASYSRYETATSFCNLLLFVYICQLAKSHRERIRRKYILWPAIESLEVEEGKGERETYAGFKFTFFSAKAVE